MSERFETARVRTLVASTAMVVSALKGLDKQTDGLCREVTRAVYRLAARYCRMAGVPRSELGPAMNGSEFRDDQG